jgi:hypothetical protein
VVDDLDKLRQGLRAMPVPGPRPGFEDRVLAKATRPRQRAATSKRAATWWAAAAGALAASIAWLMIANPFATPSEPSVFLMVNESRDVALVIDAERDLDGATIRLHVSGAVDLAGYETQRDIEWATSLTQGSNLLSLPVIAREPGDGHIVAEIEHGGRTRKVSVLMRVGPPARSTHAVGAAAGGDMA